MRKLIISADIGKVLGYERSADFDRLHEHHEKLRPVLDELLDKRKII